MKRFLGYAAAAAMISIALQQSPIQAADATDEAALGPERDPALRLVFPLVDAQRGRTLFVTKGCVICHAVNGIGGQAAPPLDAGDDATVEPLAFAARMWRGAGAMIDFQATEFGYQIDLTGDEIGHIAAFAADGTEQRQFTLDEIPDLIQELMIDEPWRPDLFEKALELD